MVNDEIFNDEEELLIHEDSIYETTQMTEEELAILQATKDAAQFVKDLQKEITPNRGSQNNLNMVKQAKSLNGYPNQSDSASCSLNEPERLSTSSAAFPI